MNGVTFSTNRQLAEGPTNWSGRLRPGVRSGNRINYPRLMAQALSTFAAVGDSGFVKEGTFRDQTSAINTSVASAQQPYIWSNPRMIFALKPHESLTYTSMEDRMYDYSEPLVKRALKERLPFTDIKFLDHAGQLLEDVENHFKNSSDSILILSQGVLGPHNRVNDLADLIRERLPEQLHNRVKILVRTSEDIEAQDPMIMGSMSRKKRFHSQIDDLAIKIHDYTAEQVDMQATISTNLVSSLNFEQYIANQRHDHDRFLTMISNYIDELREAIVQLPLDQRLSTGLYPKFQSQYLDESLNQLKQDHKNFFQAALSLESGRLVCAWDRLRTSINQSASCRQLLSDSDVERFDVLHEEYRNSLQHLFLQLSGRSRQYSIHETSLKDVLTRVEDTWNPILEKLGINLVINNKSPDAVIHTDTNALNSVFSNLMKNAVEYLSKHPELEQTISLETFVKEGKPERQFYFSLSNPGQLDASVDSATMFFHGKTSDADGDRNISGDTGLGLSSARDICNALGGQLNCNDSNNKVTLFGSLSV